MTQPKACVRLIFRETAMLYVCDRFEPAKAPEEASTVPITPQSLRDDPLTDKEAALKESTEADVETTFSCSDNVVNYALSLTMITANPDRLRMSLQSIRIYRMKHRPLSDPSTSRWRFLIRGVSVA